jgi:hypothetical protein
MLTTPKFWRCVVLSSKLSMVSRCEVSKFLQLPIEVADWHRLISLHSAFQLPVFSLASGFHFPIALRRSVLHLSPTPKPLNLSLKLAVFSTSGIINLIVNLRSHPDRLAGRFGFWLHLQPPSRQMPIICSGRCPLVSNWSNIITILAAILVNETLQACLISCSYRLKSPLSILSIQTTKFYSSLSRKILF